MKTILIGGEGDGRFLNDLVVVNPNASITVIDSSERMLALAKQRVASREHASLTRIQFLHQDLQTWSPSKDTYDTIILQFVLDCFPQAMAESILIRWTRGLRIGGQLVYADFHTPKSKLHRLRAQLWLWTMYRFFRLTTHIQAHQLPSLSPTFETLKYQLLERRRWQGDFIRSERWLRTGP